MKSFAEIFSDSRFTAAVRDPIWKHIYLTEELFEASLSLPFTRLSRIRQLGPVDILYPGATHTRAAHSYGVYHLTRQLLVKLLYRGADAWITETGFYSCLAAALFHDLGHFPYTHSLKELPLKKHETLTAEILLSEPLLTLISRTGSDPEQTAAIVDDSYQTADTETLFYRKLLSGVLDPDKLDYLNRDAFFCGVPYGMQDTDFVLSRLKPDPKLGVTLDSNSIISVESVLFAKYEMYRSVYWHETVRIATAMMKKALYSGLSERAFAPEDLYNQDDEGIYRLIRERNFTGKTAALQLYDRRLYTVCFRLPFDETNQTHLRLENLDCRAQEEKILADLFSSAYRKIIRQEDILIDIPEHISFESGLLILDENRSFSQSSTVFRGDLVQQFTRSLRILRIAVSPAVPLNQETRNKFAEICNIRYTNHA